MGAALLFRSILESALSEIEASGLPVFTFAMYHDHESGAVSVCADSEESSARAGGRSAALHTPLQLASATLGARSPASNGSDPGCERPDETQQLALLSAARHRLPPCLRGPQAATVIRKADMSEAHSSRRHWSLIERGCQERPALVRRWPAEKRAVEIRRVISMQPLFARESGPHHATVP